MLQHIAVDNEVSFALRWIAGRGHPIHSWNAGNVVDECRCTVDQPAYQIPTVASVVEDALYLPFTNVLAKNRSKDRATTVISSLSTQLRIEVYGIPGLGGVPHSLIFFGSVSSIETACFCIVKTRVVEHETAGSAFDEIDAKRWPIPNPGGQERRHQCLLYPANRSFAYNAIRSFDHLVSLQFRPVVFTSVREYHRMDWLAKFRNRYTDQPLLKCETRGGKGSSSRASW